MASVFTKEEPLISTYLYLSCGLVVILVHYFYKQIANKFASLSEKYKQEFPTGTPLANGRFVGGGNGDVCGEERGLVIYGTELEAVREALEKINDINKSYGPNSQAWTLLDGVYKFNESPIKQMIVALVRSKGGEANWHDANGNYIDSVQRWKNIRKSE